MRPLRAARELVDLALREQADLAKVTERRLAQLRQECYAAGVGESLLDDLLQYLHGSRRSYASASPQTGADGSGSGNASSSSDTSGSDESSFVRSASQASGSNHSSSDGAHRGSKSSATRTDEHSRENQEEEGGSRKPATALSSMSYVASKLPRGVSLAVVTKLFELLYLEESSRVG